MFVAEKVLLLQVISLTDEAPRRIWIYVDRMNSKVTDDIWPKQYKAEQASVYLFIGHAVYIRKI